MLFKPIHYLYQILLSALLNLISETVSLPACNQNYKMPNQVYDINSDGDVISDLFCHVVVEGWQKETGTLDSHHNAMAHYLSNHSHARGDG